MNIVAKFVIAGCAAGMLSGCASNFPNGGIAYSVPASYSSVVYQSYWHRWRPYNGGGVVYSAPVNRGVIYHAPVNRGNGGVTYRAPVNRGNGGVTYHAPVSMSNGSVTYHR